MNSNCSLTVFQLSSYEGKQSSTYPTLIIRDKKDEYSDIEPSITDYCTYYNYSTIIIHACTFPVNVHVHVQ